MDEPTQPAESTAEAKRSRGFASYCVWGFGIVVLYILSSGPAMMLSDKGVVSTKVMVIYRPLAWAYLETRLLHKPLGMYMHLWCPNRFNKQGDHP
jgi:hypothetical protein